MRKISHPRGGLPPSHPPKSPSGATLGGATTLTATLASVVLDTPVSSSGGSSHALTVVAEHTVTVKKAITLASSTVTLEVWFFFGLRFAFSLLPVV